ncbi:hypothetical protein GOAMR_03_01480 [Gordonia amarae NBRC 15530]|uniref:DUF262 domain-containing protein n=1 Tax=Gordonia amarae NBRC 15530 TaxID=1075090 RepID=G7GJ63_9ACTN|nr:hypothetical protein GOAMR_03_01480 [Gordonia amarae NBRC 15530]
MIPLFQRKYVWDEEDQWAPLWKDVRRIANLTLENPMARPQHFMGAVVLQAQAVTTANVPTWNVIDGQQRLTTLQLLMDAVSAVISERGAEKSAEQLDMLTHNPTAFVADGESALKIRHLNVDRAAFSEVMEAPVPVDYVSLTHSRTLIAQCHAYMTARAEEWLNEGEGDIAQRATVLADALQSQLQLVTIELTAEEDSQEIFETLNARGAPLTAADLVRNYVFQMLDAEGADTEKVYHQGWPFESKFWEKEISFGRRKVSRSSLFLNQWLVSRIGEEISPHSTFSRFKSYVKHSGPAMTALLPDLKQQADLYERWSVNAEESSRQLDPVEMAVYRMRASGIELLTPLLLWLHEPGKDVDAAVVAGVIGHAESWLYRRQLLRLSNSDLGRIVADFIGTSSRSEPADLPDRIQRYLRRLNAVSTYWPGDTELRTALITAPVYSRFPRARLRAFLEAVEDKYRSETKQPQVPRTSLPIEHLLPQKWQEHWPVADEVEATERQAHVNRLGNLTLLTTSLNSKVSNGAWDQKRAALQDHNTITMTGRVLTATADAAWNEELIDKRTHTLIDALLSIWPVPDGHEGVVAGQQPVSGDDVEIKHLVAAGLLKAGDQIVGRKPNEVGTITESGIDCGGNPFWSPSGAARFVRGGGHTNGWRYWSLKDGRKLADVRDEYLTKPEPTQ